MSFNFMRHIDTREIFKCEDMCNVEQRAKSSGNNSGSVRTVTEITTAYATVL